MRTMTSDASPPPASSPGPEGLRLVPFRALRFATSDPAPLLSPPYDVIDEDERRELEASDPHNVVRLILPRDFDGQPSSAYGAAASLLAAWRSAGVLVPDRTPALYVYEMEEGQAAHPRSGRRGRPDPARGRGRAAAREHDGRARWPTGWR